MKSMSSGITFDCRKDLVWAKDYDKIVVLVLDLKKTQILEGNEAVVWEYLTLDYGDAQIAAHLSYFLEISFDDAYKEFAGILFSWEKRGLIVRREEV
jgi:hypothetical protein